MDRSRGMDLWLQELLVVCRCCMVEVPIYLGIGWFSINVLSWPGEAGRHG
jgi:hypothetical protein